MAVEFEDCVNASVYAHLQAPYFVLFIIFKNIITHFTLNTWCIGLILYPCRGDYRLRSLKSCGDADAPAVVTTRDGSGVGGG